MGRVLLGNFTRKGRKRNMKITLYDQDGNSYGCEDTMVNGELVSKMLWSDDGYGDSITEKAEIDGISISGDFWRFLEGTLGLEELHWALNNEYLDTAFLTAFKKTFTGTSSDDEALVAWNVAVADRLAPVAHMLPSSEFCRVAKAVKLHNHGRQWEVFIGNKSLGVCDSPAEQDALREAHCREVNNALYSNTKEAPAFMPKMSMPPEDVIAEHPQLRERFADVLKQATPA